MYECDYAARERRDSERREELRDRRQAERYGYNYTNYEYSYIRDDNWRRY